MSPIRRKPAPSTTARTKSNHYTRPGVEAAVRLSSMIHEIDQWEVVMNRYYDMLNSKGGTKLVDLDAKCEQIRENLSVLQQQQASSTNNNNENKKKKGNHQKSINKADLMNIVQWKFGKGKPRYPLIKLLESNQDDTIMKCSQKAFTISDSATTTTTSTNNTKNQTNNSIIRQSIDALCELKGVGPATASAVLSLYQPDLYVFMDDEIIEALFDGKRAYTTPIYLSVNEKCINIANQLNNNNNNQVSSKAGGNNNNQKKNQNSNNKNWTARRVGQALWTACRLASTPNEVDYTLKKLNDTTARDTNDEDDDDNTNNNSYKKHNNKKRQNKTNDDEINEEQGKSAKNQKLTSSTKITTASSTSKRKKT